MGESKYPRLTPEVRELEIHATRRHDVQSHLGHFSLRSLLRSSKITFSKRDGPVSRELSYGGFETAKERLMKRSDVFPSDLT